jgi:GNAT superfamily N-acetyltransferase
VASTQADVADPSVVLLVVEPARFEEAVPDLASLLVDAVASGASVSFLRGLDQSRAEAWWRGRTDDVGAGTLVMLVARDHGRIVGCAGLVAAKSENSAHRGEVIKVLVSRSHRRQGIASALLSAVEAEALRRGRWLLMLDAVAGGGPEAFYRANGWQVLGVVPDFAVTTDGALEPCVFMWKRLIP